MVRWPNYHTGDGLIKLDSDLSSDERKEDRGTKVLAGKSCSLLKLVILIDVGQR
jgi:hypothetical protein